MSANKDPFCRKQFTRKESDEAIEQFLSNGGEIIKLRRDDGTYEKISKKIEGKFEDGYIKVFSKAEALREN